MTDAHQSPLLLLPLKTTEEVDFGSAVMSLITNSYGEDPKRYSEQTSQLNRARQDAVKGAASDATGRDLLFKWFHMLEMLELRFPELRVPFPWKDAFTQKAISQSSLAYEKASIIFNIAATLSSLASSQPRMSGNADGLKRAYTALRQAAGMLSYINENFLHAPSTDMSKDVVKCLVGITLAQASEVFLEKTIEEKKGHGLISKLASQTAAAYTAIVEDSRENVTKGVFERSWTYLIQVKARHFTSVMQYYKALADDTAGSHGACLVRLTVAETAAREAKNLLTNFATAAAASVTADRPSLPSDAVSALTAIVNAQLVRCNERKETAVKDNDLIYHDILPSESSLPAVDKLVAATPIPIQEIFAAPEVQRVIGPDLFQNLVPLGVHEKASLYSEEKAKIARAESERHDLATVELQTSLDYLGLPGSLNKYRAVAQGSGSGAMLDSLSDPGAEVMGWSNEEAEGGGGRGADGLGVGAAGVDSALQRIESIKSQAAADIDAALSALDDENRECEKQRVRFGHKWNQDPSGLHTKEMRLNLKENMEAMQQASDNDAQITELWKSIREDVQLLVLGREALEAAFAAALTGQTGLYGNNNQASLIDTSAEEEQVSESEVAAAKAKLSQIDEALSKLNKIKKERSEVLADLKEKIQTDDISQVLVLNRRAQNVDSSIFAAELEKFKPHQNRIAVSLHHQQTLLAEINTAFKELSELPASKSARAKWDDKEKARNKLTARLKRARDSNAQVRAGVAKGLQFYSDLQGIVKSTRQTVNRYVGDRKAERLKMVSELEWEEKGSSGGGAGVLAASMAGLSMGGSPAPPPAPHRQTSYGSVYSGGPLSTGPLPPPLPDARRETSQLYSSGLPPPPPLPHQQPSYQQQQPPASPARDPYGSMFSSGPFSDVRSSPVAQQPPQQQQKPPAAYGSLRHGGADSHTQPARQLSGGALPPPPQQFQTAFSPAPTSALQNRYASPPPPPSQSGYGPQQQGGYGSMFVPPQQARHGYGAGYDGHGGREYSSPLPQSPYGAPPQSTQYGGYGQSQQQQQQQQQQPQSYGSQPQHQGYGAPQQSYGAPQSGYGAGRGPPPPPPPQQTQYQQAPHQGGYAEGYQPRY
ncbi:probable Vacuolar protein-sorting protein BRO1 [Melanopsichium pennsylvanicum]|uniref:BRO domain-containing protein 1 n=2 Tax=Melanopsichium pennsylvanicum TaxID=63383 RepID=A0AAJ4XG49_9BASI|nr:related to BRO1-cytoplasmic class E vacuolar protein sorting (VPS) factor [Melanopsichium pennsylvanicum 4]SNX81845.1 probable Vacuolar protein-sorting protein BRO1 [Melanopsichium pennsylvanicum]